MLRRPTPSVRFERGRASHWRLISHLALNHVSLANSGLSALKEMLVLYDLRRTAVSARHIDGLVGIEQRAQRCNGCRANRLQPSCVALRFV